MYHESSYGNGFFSIIKAVLASLAFSFLASVIFAVVIETGCVQQRWIYPVTQMLKSVALVFGVLTFIRGERGWLKGAGAGLLFTALSYLAFSALGGDFSLGWLIIVEIALAFIVGAIGGIVAVNLKK